MSNTERGAIVGAYFALRSIGEALVAIAPHSSRALLVAAKGLSSATDAGHFAEESYPAMLALAESKARQDADRRRFAWLDEPIPYVLVDKLNGGSLNG